MTFWDHILGMTVHVIPRFRDHIVGTKFCHAWIQGPHVGDYSSGSTILGQHGDHNSGTMFQEPYLTTQNDENLHIFILILYTAFQNGKIIFVKICDKMTVFIQNLQETRMNTSKII